MTSSIIEVELLSLLSLFPSSVEASQLSTSVLLQDIINRESSTVQVSCVGWLGYLFAGDRSESLRKLTVEGWSEDVIHDAARGTQAPTT